MWTIKHQNPIARNNGSLRPVRRGAVIIEFVLCVPILAFILALIFFFGWSMMNQQHVKVAARYAAWAPVRGGYTAPDQLNRDFFSDKADPVTDSADDGPHDTLRLYCDKAGVSLPLAVELVLQRAPAGRHAYVSARFPSEVNVWNRFEGSIHGDRARDGVEWRRNQAAIDDALRELYLMELDRTLEDVPAPGDGLSLVFRRLYMTIW